jgi:hypothetical protein
MSTKLSFFACLAIAGVNMLETNVPMLGTGAGCYSWGVNVILGILTTRQIVPGVLQGRADSMTYESREGAVQLVQAISLACRSHLQLSEGTAANHPVHAALAGIEG